MKSNNAIKKVTVALLYIFMGLSLKAQDSTKVNSLNKLKLSLVGLGFEREQAIGKTITIYGGAGINGALVYETTFQVDNNYNFTSNTDTHFKIYPTLNAGFRHYYNFERRIKKGKNTKNNSAGYVGLDILGIFPTSTSISNQLNIMPQWGFQTAAGKKVNFELALGPALSVTKNETLIDVYAKIGFNFLL